MLRWALLCTDRVVQGKVWESLVDHLVHIVRNDKVSFPTKGKSTLTISYSPHSPVVIAGIRWPNARALNVGRPQHSIAPFQARVGVLLTPLKVDRQEILVLPIPKLLDRSRLAGADSDFLRSENRRREGCMQFLVECEF